METSGSIELEGSTDTLVSPASGSAPLDFSQNNLQTSKDSDASSSQARKRGFFRRNSRTSAHSSGGSSGSTTLRGDERDTQQLPSHQERDGYVRLPLFRSLFVGNTRVTTKLSFYIGIFKWKC